MQWWKRRDREGCLMGSNMIFLGSPLLCVVIAIFALLGCVAPSSLSSEEQQIMSQIRVLHKSTAQLRRDLFEGRKLEDGDGLEQRIRTLINDLARFHIQLRFDLFEKLEGRNELEIIAGKIQDSVYRVNFSFMRSGSVFQHLLWDGLEPIVSGLESIEEILRSSNEDHGINKNYVLLVLNSLYSLSNK